MSISVSKLSQTAILAVAVWLPSAQADNEYLLTGVISASGGGKAFAVIEQADGQQRLVSEGDSLGDGRVKKIHTETNTVRLELPGGDVVLTLRGSAHPVEHVEGYRIEDFQEESPSVLTLDDSAVQGLLELAGQAQKLGEEKSIVRLNKLLGLSSGASIAAFNEEQVDSSAQLLEQLAGVLAKGEDGVTHVGTISVADDLGHRRVYLSRPVATP